MLDSGILTLYHAATTDAVRSGDRPEDGRAPYYTGWYGERTVGYGRFWAAQGVNTRVDRLVRVLRPAEAVDGGDLARLEDGYIYRILQAQMIRDEDSGEDVCDLSLERLGERYGKAVREA